MQNTQKNLYKKLFGLNGEKIALKNFKKLGYKLIEKNYRTKFGEADIIMEKDEVLYFIEVKTRSNDKFGMPCEAVDYKKQERYRNIANYYLMINKLQDVNVNFTVVEVFKDKKINIIENAF